MNQIQNSFDVIVVGGGHAGIEAAYAAANMGSKTALITLDANKIGVAPCNPSVGGVGKGHIVFEISALGGLMPKICSKTYLQARMLNTKKGPAVQGLRLQIDKEAYADLASKIMHNTPNLTVVQAMVDEIIVENNQIRGIKSSDGTIYTANQVVLTTGTFLNGLIHIGDVNFAAGRSGEQAAIKLSNYLTKLNLRMGRLKTGTPPRLDPATIDFSKLERQETEPLTHLFEFDQMDVSSSHDCFIAHTNEKTHKIIFDNLHKSAMYSGNIKGVGPRYCPSIEDKISRFADKQSHHIFVEPETAAYVEVYPSGISTSLPESVQKDFIQSIVGFENAVITKPGYAVEYDFVHPDQLHHSLEVKSIQGLFLAGQINGTTGYEEAAGQGVIAGINAHQKATGKDPFILDRNESYIGVMIDDLVTMGVDEPYRMFTSRAERRLVLRQDNAFLRLTEKGYQLGTVTQELYDKFLQEKHDLEVAIIDLDKRYNNAELVKAAEQEIPMQEIIENLLGYTVSARNALSLFAHIKYREYIKRENREVEKVQQHRQIKLPDMDAILNISGLSTEIKQKIARYKPATVADAMLIPGITPAAISLLVLVSRKPELAK
ncbi:tRNA uridine-5-carboxymethylaminomethyl(34) synthesis enzyme MnmG [Candidatus Chromulinivorax destructor]|uniref:tRNA uridine 5-carboxymethylaminomethyl modification enzyme MnmG n=1 Tax=Candidatus Chromulinivorax destructor TaxID=2066483 RepID=A0A345ZD34_9BACT|nr:tRNA uridine-5-carboxymethylaminomethyl(34) synthesis enzyme MnmG [Candidatus Chromulinivorax destructor]AXK61201.1 tRNA uridine-5-carboxymethylaminomethyl(34) synthesis enzyme MnmG [Candidatus Chromulinivorax destructor]